MNPWQHHFQNVMRDGETCFDGDDLSGAQQYFEEALSLIPEPKQKHAEATQVVVALADCLCRLGEYEKAMFALDDALLCPGGAANPFIRLKRGQVLSRLGEAKKAKLELTTAYLNGGPDVFEGNSGLLDLIADVVAGLPKH